MCAGEWPNACDPSILHPVGRFEAWARNEFHSELERLGDDTGSMPRRRPSVSSTVRRLLRDLGTFVWLGLTSRARPAAENLFLRKQLAGLLRLSTLIIPRTW